MAAAYRLRSRPLRARCGLGSPCANTLQNWNRDVKAMNKPTQARIGARSTITPNRLQAAPAVMWVVQSGSVIAPLPEEVE